MSGVVDLISSALIFAGLPSTAAWAIGLSASIKTIFGEVALTAMALHAGKSIWRLPMRSRHRTCR